MKHATWWSALCVMLFSVLSCSQTDPSGQKAPPPVGVNIFTVSQGSGIYFDEYPATVAALTEVDVRPQVAGYITGIFFKEGQHVTKGEKLYAIDQQQYRASYEQAVANLNVSQANLAKAQQDADRYEELSKQDAIARQTLDHALADLESAKKTVDAAKANVIAVQTNLRYTTIYAPFTGTIGISNVKLGASVLPGQTVLNTISSDDPIAVDVPIDQRQIPRFVDLEEQEKSMLSDSIFTVVLPDLTRYPYHGSIYFIDRAVDPQTATIKTRLKFANPKKILKVGMTCNVRIQNNTSGETILIPQKSLMEQMGEYFVFVVGDSNKVYQHKITIGPKIGDKVIVRDGLKINEKIVTDGVQKLRDGAVVQISPSQSANKPDSSKASIPRDSMKGK